VTAPATTCPHCGSADVTQAGDDSDVLACGTCGGAWALPQPQVRLLPGQAALIKCPHCGVPFTACPHGSVSSSAYTDPEVLTAGVEQGWADPETDPTRIDWPARQAAAAIPFRVDGGRPVNPCAVTAVRHGRNQMGRWGENLMADALVTVTCRGVRHLLMVERGDGYGWAVPGGTVEPGETGVRAAVRELAEETGLAVPPAAGRPGEPLYVPDPRASDEAWAVTIPVTIGLGDDAGELPAVQGADDARRAAWIPAATYTHLTSSLILGYGCVRGQVFAAHVAMLRRHLDGEEVRHG
jgi:ADP-ribose pyrophosphatase YjhB (NUDIX family)